MTSMGQENKGQSPHTSVNVLQLHNHNYVHSVQGHADEAVKERNIVLLNILGNWSMKIFQETLSHL